MASKVSSKWLAWLLTFLLSCIWGSSYILMKKGLKVFSSQEVGALRVVSAAIILLPISLPQLSKLSIKQYFLLLASGLLGTFFPAFIYAEAQMHLDSAILGIFNALTPISVLLVSTLVFQRKVFRNELVGTLMGISGAITLILVDAHHHLGQVNHYFFLPLLGGFLYANNSNLVKYYLQNLNAGTIGGVSLLLVGIPMAVILFAQTQFVAKLQAVEGAYQAMGYVVTLGILGSGMAFILFSKIVLLTSPVFANVVSFLIPLVALFWGLLDGEVLVWGHYLGIATILTGLYLFNKQQKS